MVRLMRMTPDGQASRAFTTFSITRPWMNFGPAGTSSTNRTAPGSLSWYSAFTSSKMLPMSFFTDSRFSAGTTVSTTASNGMALRREPPVKLTTCTPNTSMSGRRMRAITLFALARYREMSMPEWPPWRPLTVSFKPFQPGFVGYLRYLNSAETSRPPAQPTHSSPSSSESRLMRMSPFRTPGFRAVAPVMPVSSS